MPCWRSRLKRSQKVYCTAGLPSPQDCSAHSASSSMVLAFTESRMDSAVPAKLFPSGYPFKWIDTSQRSRTWVPSRRHRFSSPGRIKRSHCAGGVISSHLLAHFIAGPSILGPSFLHLFSTKKRPLALHCCCPMLVLKPALLATSTESRSPIQPQALPG